MSEEKTAVTTTVVSEEVAQAEVKKWLDAKRVGQSERKSKEYQIGTLESAVMDGVLILDDKCRWVQTLNFPLEAIGVAKLTFASRMTADETITASAAAEGVPSLVMSCYLSHLTGEASGTLRKMDSVDYKIASAIGIFFY